MVHQGMLYAIAILEGVKEVHIAENNTWAYDFERGLPALSIRVTVEGGNSKEIANAIWNHKIIGVLTRGMTKVKVKDSFGLKYKIYFDHI